MKRTEKFYNFFYCLDHMAIDEKITLIKLCKSPKKTDEYKRLKKLFEDDLITSYGYEVNEEATELHDLERECNNKVKELINNSLPF